MKYLLCNITMCILTFVTFPCVYIHVYTHDSVYLLYSCIVMKYLLCNMKGCCQYDSRGFDCVHIPGAEEANSEKLLKGSNFCGKKFANVEEGTSDKTICSEYTNVVSASINGPEMVVFEIL